MNDFNGIDSEQMIAAFGGGLIALSGLFVTLINITG